MFIHLKINQKLDFIFNLALKLNKTTFLLIKSETFCLWHFKLLSVQSKKNCGKNSEHLLTKLHMGVKIPLRVMNFLWILQCAPLGELYF